MDPSVTSGLYRDITDLAHDSPSWVRHFVEIGTEAVIVILGVLFLASWWRRRTADSRAMAVAVVGPLATAVAYVGSELFKSAVQEERPCRAVAGAAASLATCPPVGDWSFPSNHSTIAAAAAVALALAWRAIAFLTIPLALFAAFSRVFVGVHYPHDVAVGLLFGGLVATLVVLALTRPARALIETMRTSRTGVVVWFAGRGPTPQPAWAPATAQAAGGGQAQGSGYGAGYGSADGAGYGSGYGSADGSGYGSGYGSADGSGYGSGHGPAQGPGYGPGHASADGPGHGSPHGSGYGTGYGSADGSGYGTGHGPADGSGYGSGHGPAQGPGYGPGHGAAHGSDHGSDYGAGPGSEPDQQAQQQNGPATGPGRRRQ